MSKKHQFQCSKVYQGHVIHVNQGPLDEGIITSTSKFYSEYSLFTFLKQYIYSSTPNWKTLKCRAIKSKIKKYP